MLRHSLVIALLAVTLVGCVNRRPPIDRGEGEGEGEGEGNTGDSCAAAIALVDGVAVEGDTSAGAADDLELGCLFVPGHAADLVYAIDVTGQASLTATLATELDLAIAIFDAASCGEADQLACADVSLDAEEAFVPLVEPGRYFIVIDGNADEAGAPINGAFTLTVSTGDPVCTDDVLDGAPGNNTFDLASNLGGDSIDTATIDADDSTPAIDAVDLHNCPGDVDYFLFAHLGGPISASVTPRVGESGTVSGELHTATIDEPASLTAFAAGGALVITGEGAPIPLATAAAEAAAGYYLLKVTESGAALANAIAYDFVFSHACEPDFFDSPFASLDDATLVGTDLGALVSADTDPAAPLKRSLCLGDADAFFVQPIAPGSLALTIDGADLTIAITQVQLADTQRVESAAVFADVATGDSHAITIAGIDEFHGYIVRVSELSASTTSNRYTVGATFSYTPPDNETCATASALAISDSGASTHGNTAAAAHELVGLCNGDDPADVPHLAADVFYQLSVVAETNLQLQVKGGDAFSGTVTLYQAPGDTCPADLSTLVPMALDGSTATAEDQDLACGSRIRVSNVPAGDYLVAVDGDAGALVFGIFDVPASRGGFDVEARSFPEGFPPAEACSSATAVTLPAASAASLVLPIVFADLSLESELVGSCGGNGQEMVFTFTAAADGTATFTTANPDYDTVVYLREAACEGAAALELAEGCSDDSEAGSNSALTVQVAAGTTYFLVVDTYFAVAAADGETSLSISVE